MGIFTSKHTVDLKAEIDNITNGLPIHHIEITEGLDDLIKQTANIVAYDMVVTDIFEDKISVGRTLAWYMYSIAVRRHLSLDHHDELHKSFMKWWKVLSNRMPEHTDSLLKIRQDWVKTRIHFKSVHVQTEV